MCDELLHRRLYRIDDLLAPEQDADSFQEKLRKTVAPDHWEDEGGPGAIVPVGRHWLLVAASTRMHEELSDYLTEQRTGKQPQRAVERAAWKERLKTPFEIPEGKKLPDFDPFAESRFLPSNR